MISNDNFSATWNLLNPEYHTVERVAAGSTFLLVTSGLQGTS